MNSFSKPQKSVFPPDPLDTKDRQILEVIYNYGRKGQSFNKLVEEVKPFVSRSTFSTRVERLQRLGYIDKTPDPERKQVKLISGTLQFRIFMWMIRRTKDVISQIGGRLSEKEKEIAEISEMLQPEHIEDFRTYVRGELEKIGQTFSSVATAAVAYGESAAGDIFLPSLMESLREVMLRLASIVKNNRELTVAAFLTENQLDQDKILEAEMFFEEFGVEFLESIPESMKSRKDILEEMMNKPEMLRQLIPSLWYRT